MKMNAIPDEQKVGIELELSSPKNETLEKVANALQGADFAVRKYEKCHKTVVSDWKIVPDTSIVCNVLNCNTFELVSPILRGEAGLKTASKVVARLQSIRPQVYVNKSMGFHVHVDVSAYSIKQLIKICQNFIKYEDVMDTLMPPSRRTGSEQSKRYFKSNQQSVVMYVKDRFDLPHGASVANKQCHDALGRCADVKTLANLMNSDGRYFKLNMQNLVSERQPTLEFRQHSATANHMKVDAWIRFCVALCKNSAKLGLENNLEEECSSDDRFTDLFHHVIKDAGLEDYYKARQQKLQQKLEQKESACCEKCA